MHAINIRDRVLQMVLSEQCERRLTTRQRIDRDVTKVGTTGRDIAVCVENRLVIGDRKELSKVLATDRAAATQFDIKIGERVAGKIKEGVGRDLGHIVEQNYQPCAGLHECHFFVGDRREVEFHALIV